MARRISPHRTLLFVMQLPFFGIVVRYSVFQPLKQATNLDVHQNDPSIAKASIDPVWHHSSLCHSPISEAIPVSFIFTSHHTRAYSKKGNTIPLARYLVLYARRARGRVCSENLAIRKHHWAGPLRTTTTRDYLPLYRICLCRLKNKS